MGDSTDGSVRIRLNHVGFVCRVSVRHDNKKVEAYASDARLLSYLLSQEAESSRELPNRRVIDEARERTASGG